MNYFKKEILTNPLRYSDGSQAVFEACAENCGVIALDPEKPAEALKIADLTKVAGTRGVIRITVDQYDAFKKKLPSNSQSAQLKGPRLSEQVDQWSGLITSPKPANVVTAPGVAAVAAGGLVATDAMVAEQSKAFKPRTGKRKTSL